MLGDEKSHISVTLTGNNITAEFALDGLETSSVTAEKAYNSGEWTTLRLITDNGKAQLIVNGNKAAEGDIPVSPKDVADAVDYGEGVYRIGSGFNGSVDFIRFFSGKTDAPSETYSGKEDVSVQQPPETPTEILWGDANCDGLVNMSDAVMIMQSLANPSRFQLTAEGKANADCSGNGNGITNGDALAIQKYCLELLETLPEA